MEDDVLGGPRMAAGRYGLLLLTLVSSCAVADDLGAVRLGNQLADCVSVTDTAIHREGAFPVLSFEMKVREPIAECGCKSALGMYTVYSSAEGYESYVISGKAAFGASGEKHLPLSAEPTLIKDGPLVVTLSCAQPD